MSWFLVTARIISIELNIIVILFSSEEDASATQRDMWTKSQEANLCGHPLCGAGVMVKALDMEW